MSIFMNIDVKCVPIYYNLFAIISNLTLIDIVWYLLQECIILYKEFNFVKNLIIMIFHSMIVYVYKAFMISAWSLKGLNSFLSKMINYIFYIYKNKMKQFSNLL